MTVVRDAHKNFAYSTVLTPPTPAASGTSVVVQAGDGAKFPTPPFNVTIWPVGSMPVVSNAEIARCTAIATDTLTIARAQEGSSARSVIATDQIAATITAKTLTDAEDSFVYNGDWASQNYLDGDLVVYNNMLWICVNPTNAAPAAWPGGPTIPANYNVPYGTSLPVSPTDGQEAILVDSLTNPTYQWRFRYNAGSTSTYKWEFVGGIPILAGPQGSLTTATNATWLDLTSGPTLTVPRAGVYIVEHGCGIQNNGATSGGYTAYSSLLFSTTGRGAQPQLSGSAVYWAGFTNYLQLMTLVAGETVKMQVQINAAYSTNFYTGMIKLTPVKVS